MKLVSYLQTGGLSPGVLVDDSVVAVDRLVRRADLNASVSYDSVRNILATATADDLRALDAAARDAAAELGTSLAEATLGPPIPDPQKILCIGLNYHDHVGEAISTNAPIGGGDPVVFSKFPTSLIGPGAFIELPRIAPDQVDYEGELGVAIGKVASRVSQEDALEYVAGYMPMNDVSARDLQTATPQWTMGKAFDTSGPCGPALVTVDEIPDPQALELRTILNGEEVQSTNTSLMIHSVARLIEFISSAITLVPGDIISTGTPAGIGLVREPPLFLRAGDTVTVSISGLGELTNPVRHEL